VSLSSQKVIQYNLAQAGLTTPIRHAKSLKKRHSHVWANSLREARPEKYSDRRNTATRKIQEPEQQYRGQNNTGEKDATYLRPSSPIAGQSKSISRVLFRLHLADGDDHSSRTYVTACLKRPNPEALGEQPLSPFIRSGTNWERLPIWSCSGWGLPSSRCHHRDWCALTAPFHPYQVTLYSGSPFHTGTWRFLFCGTILRVTPTGRYPAPCSTEPGLSSLRRVDEERSPDLLCPAIGWSSPP